MNIRPFVLPALLLALPLAAYCANGHTPQDTLEIVTRRYLAREPGNSPACWGGVRIVRTGDLSKNLVVKISMTGTADLDRDYLISPQQNGSGILMPAGLDSLTLVVRPINDDEIEGAESVDFELLPGADYNVGTFSRASVRIDDKDPAVPTDPDASETGL